MHLLIQFLQLQIAAAFCLYAPVQLVHVLILSSLIGLVLVFKGVDLHVIEGYGHIQVDEVVRSPKLLLS